MASFLIGVFLHLSIEARMMFHSQFTSVTLQIIRHLSPNCLGQVMHSLHIYQPGSDTGTPVADPEIVGRGLQLPFLS